MKRLSVLTLALILCAVPAAFAQPAGDCLVGPGTAATLLYPYFEADPISTGVSTLLSVNNSVGVATLARVVLWTDTATPTMAFDIYLGGFDIVTINVRDLFNGNLPSTGGGADLSGFIGCDTEPPTYQNPVGTEDQRAQLRADHTGVAGPLFGTCIGSATGDGIARGYITVDTVSRCSGAEVLESSTNPRFDSSYFGNGGTGLATNDNVLWGDLIIIDQDDAAAQGFSAIPVWANVSKLSGQGAYTFYGRYSNYSGNDNRVPLPNLWNQRFLNGGPFAGGASLVVWRDSGTADGSSSFTCGGLPAGFPLDQTLSALDEDGGSLTDISDSTAVSLATQRADISEFGLAIPFGFIQLLSGDLQSWVMPTLTAGGLYSAGFTGSPNDFLCGTTPPTAATAKAIATKDRPARR